LKQSERGCKSVSCVDDCVKIAGSLDSFTIVLTRISFFVLELNKNKKKIEINAYAAYDAETPLKPLHLKEKSLVKSSNRDTLQYATQIYTVKGLGTGHLPISSRT
jgi:hypothetical protein